MAKRKGLPEIEFYDYTGVLIKRCRLDALSFREETVLRLSLEFFQDPEPCMIRRSAVISRILMELLDYFQELSRCGLDGIPLKDMPPRLAEFLQVPCCVRVNFVDC
jgi:hypothetical protein